MKAEAPSRPGIAEALERVISSKTFARAERHRALLRHLVQKTLADRTGELKEYTIALDVFGRDSYDPQVDSQVRVEVGKLRERLARYYDAQGAADTLRIEIPRGSYTPVFRAPAEPASAGPPPRPVPSRGRAFWYAAVVLTLVATSTFVARTGTRSSSAAFKPAIAILPFEDLSPAKDQEYFCSGISEELIGSLTSLEIFRVLPRSSVAQYKRNRTNVREVGRQLNVHAVVEGTVRREQNRVRVTVQLLDTREGFQLWNQTYDRQLGDILAIQREIAGDVAKAFHVDLPGARRALVRRQTGNPEAYLRYLRAAHLFESDFEKSVEFYRAAIAADPGYALAWAGLADSWNRMVDWQLVTPAAGRAQATAAALKAVSLDPNLPEAHHALGVGRLFYQHDWRGAEQALLRAIELEPTHGDYRWEYARLILTPTGRFAESADLMRRAIALEPFKVALHDLLATSLIRARQYDAALPALEAARQTAPGAPSPVVATGVAAASQGRYDEAVRHFKEAAGIRRTNWVLGHLGFALAKLGREEEARGVVGELRRPHPSGVVADFEVAVVTTALGDHDAAMAGFERAAAAFSPSMLWLNVDYRLQELRRHPGFPALAKSVGLASAVQ
jgi:serine/threonine-protein kinase